MAIKIDMLRVFQAVAEEGALAQAAERLARSPSAVSMMLSRFEEEIGAPLFETERKGRLTPLGRLVLEESRRATENFSRSLTAIRRHAQSVAGTLRVAAVPSATGTLLPKVIADFQRRHPDVRLEIGDADSASVLASVMHDETDIGILSGGVDHAGGLTSAVILRDDLGIVARKGGAVARAAARREGPRWADLACEPLIANPLCEQINDPALQGLLLASALEARNTSTLLAFVRAGLGATVLPRSVLSGDDGGLVFLHPVDPPARRELRKIRTTARMPTPLAEAFWQVLRLP